MGIQVHKTFLKIAIHSIIIIFIGLLSTQAVFMLLATLSLITNTNVAPPLIRVSHEAPGSTVVSGDVMLIPIGFLIAGLMDISFLKYSKTHKNRLYVDPVTIAILVILGISVAAFVSFCPYTCPVLTCAGRGVKKCETSVGWLYVKTVCECIS